MSGEEPEKDKEYKLPEFVFVDETEEKRERYSRFEGSEEYFEPFERLERASYPFVLRLFTFAIAAGLIAGGIIVVCGLAFSLGIAAICFFQVEPFNVVATRLWNALRKIAVISMGLFTATISPAFGFSMIMVYFLLRGEAESNALLNRILQQMQSRIRP